MDTIFTVKSLFYKVISLPTMGYLARQGTKLVIGDRFSPDEVRRGDITYTNTVAIPEGTQAVVDNFQFALWDADFGVVTSTMYSPCAPTFDIPTPENGIFTFDIRINRSTAPNARIGEPNVFLVGSTFPVTPLFFTAETSGLTDSQIVYQASGLKNGYLLVQGLPNDRFTQADMVAGKVLYVNTQLGDGTEHMDLTVCNFRSQCSDISVDWAIQGVFEQTGDNVIYARVGEPFFWEFQTNSQDAIWQLFGGSDIAPPNASTPSNKIIEWSTYALTSNLPDGDPGRGEGYDKLPEYRNLKELQLWGGGLPKAVGISNRGWLGTGYRLPQSEAGSQPWSMPKAAGEYFFTLQATDPRTGMVSFRRYKLVVNINGTSIGGLTSESKDL